MLSFLRLWRRANSASMAPRENALPVMPSTALLDTPSRRDHLRMIEQLAGISKSHFDALYQSALENYALWVQQLPASEAHHHAGPGGILDHALEVTAGALARRRAHLLPQGADPEIIARHQHRWTYAVFSAALLHDVGKPAVDQSVTLIDGAQHERVWDPWSGPMPRGHWYRVNFVRFRQYRLHEAVTPLLARLILPQCGLSWLAEDHDALTEWLAALSGDRENGGVISKLVGQADGESVARNLGAGDAARFPTARVIPLHERLLTALRHLLSTGALPLNRNGGSGWLIDDELWLVSKRVTDSLRDHLVQEGHDGIPTRNERIFDVLQEHRLVIPNGDRAIWTADVAGEGWTHRFTLLRFSSSRIWSNPDARPAPFVGTVTPIAEGAADTEPRATTPVEQRETSTPASSVAATSISEETREQSASDTSIGIADEFFSWLRSGVANGHLRVNRADARIHVVPEGVLLASPVIFRDFASARNDPKSWDKTQKAVCKVGRHLRGAQDTNILHYKVELPGRNHDGATQVLNGIVIVDPNIVFGDLPVPEVNPLLMRVEK